MMRRAASLGIAVAALAACSPIILPAMVAAWPAEIPLNEERVPRSARPSAERVGGTVTVAVAPEVKKLVVPAPSKAGTRTPHVRLGAIVEYAARSALEDVLRDKPLRSDSAFVNAPLPDATLSIHSARLANSDRRLRVEWRKGENVQIYESRVSLAFDAIVFDARGRVVWSRIYEEEDLRFTWTIPSDKPFPLLGGLEAAVHDAVGRLAQRAADDLAAWLQAERMKPRAL